MAAKKKKTTTVVEEIPENQTGLDDQGETSTFDLDMQRADDISTVEQLLADNGISNVTYRFYDNDGGYCYSSNELDYDRARKETKGGKNCKLAVFVGNKILRMVPFPLAPVDPAAPTHSNGNGNGNTDVAFLKDMVLKLMERGNTPPIAPPPVTLTDLTTALSNMDSLRGKQESGLEHFTKGVEFAMKMGGQTDWRTEAITAAREVIPHVTDAITAFRGGTPPVIASQQSEPGKEPMPITEQMPPKDVLMQGLGYLKKKALSGLEPDFVIEWVTNNAEEFQSIVVVVLNQEFSYFVQLDPEIGTEPYLSWFRRVFDGLRREFSPPNPVDEHPGGRARDDYYTGNDGEPRPGPRGVEKPKD